MHSVGRVIAFVLIVNLSIDEVLDRVKAILKLQLLRRDIVLINRVFNWKLERLCAMRVYAIPYFQWQVKQMWCLHGEYGGSWMVKDKRELLYSSRLLSSLM